MLHRLEPCMECHMGWSLWWATSPQLLTAVGARNGSGHAKACHTERGRRAHCFGGPERVACRRAMRARVLNHCRASGGISVSAGGVRRSRGRGGLRVVYIRRELQSTKNQRRCRSLVEEREGGSEAVTVAGAASGMETIKASARWPLCLCVLERG